MLVKWAFTYYCNRWTRRNSHADGEPMRDGRFPGVTGSLEEAQYFKTSGMYENDVAVPRLSFCSSGPFETCVVGPFFVLWNAVYCRFALFFLTQASV